MRIKFSSVQDYLRTQRKNIEYDKPVLLPKTPLKVGLSRCIQYELRNQEIVIRAHTLEGGEPIKTCNYVLCSLTHISSVLVWCNLEDAS